MADYSLGKNARLNVLFTDKAPRIVEPLDFKEELYRFISVIQNNRSQAEPVFVSFYAGSSIRPVLQCGLPICGMAAITMAYQLLNDSKNITPAVQPLSVLKIAQDGGFSKQGEILSTETMLYLSKEAIGCTGVEMSIDKLTPVSLLQSLISHSAILVPYDCDKDHTPFICNGHEAHWCIIVGVVIINTETQSELLKYCRKDSECVSHFELHLSNNDKDIERVIATIDHTPFNDVMVIARHGKSRHLGFWPLSKLQESNMNLKELNPHRDPQSLVVPVGGLEHCLRSKFVLLEANKAFEQ